MSLVASIHTRMNQILMISRGVGNTPPTYSYLLNRFPSRLATHYHFNTQALIKRIPKILSYHSQLKSKFSTSLAETENHTIISILSLAAVSNPTVAPLAVPSFLQIRAMSLVEQESQNSININDITPESKR